MEGYQQGIGRGRLGELKDSMGNREAKELLCVTHGCELNGGWNAGGKG